MLCQRRNLWNASLNKQPPIWILRSKTKTWVIKWFGNSQTQCDNVKCYGNVKYYSRFLKQIFNCLTIMVPKIIEPQLIQQESNATTLSRKIRQQLKTHQQKLLLLINQIYQFHKGGNVKINSPINRNWLTQVLSQKETSCQ